MRRLITIAAMMTSLAAFGQDSLNLKASTEFRKILLGVNVSTDYCYRTLKNNDDNFINSTIIDMRNKYERPVMGYTAGLNLCYNISKNFGIELGTQYSKKSYSLKVSDLFFGDMIDPRYGFAYSTIGTEAKTLKKFIYNYIYLDVPLNAIFSFGEKRIRFITSIGVTTNILLKSTQTNVFEYEDGDTKRETHDQQYNYNTLNISPTISAGIDYKISKKINLRAEPTFRYGLLKTINTPITVYLWSGGLNFTCYYSLR